MFDTTVTKQTNAPNFPKSVGLNALDPHKKIYSLFYHNVWACVFVVWSFATHTRDGVCMWGVGGLLVVNVVLMFFVCVV